MGFDLNGGEFSNSGSIIFNNGQAGKVENVSIDVIKKRADEMEMSPDYKVIFTEDAGAQINMGIYYPTNNPDKDAEANKRLENLAVSRAVAIAKSVVEPGYKFPEVDSAKEAIDVLMKITKENAEGKKVNVFATYGTQGTPKKYLGIYKNFDFIEKAGTSASRLRATVNPNKPQYDDLLERIVEDAPVSGDVVKEKTSNLWGK